MNKKEKQKIENLIGSKVQVIVLDNNNRYIDGFLDTFKEIDYNFYCNDNDYFNLLDTHINTFDKATILILKKKKIK